MSIHVKFRSIGLAFAFLLAFAGSAQAQLPDVRVTQIELVPANPVAGQTVDFWVTMTNSGSGSTPQGVDVGLGVQVDGAFAGSYFVRSGLGTGPTLPLQAGANYRWKTSPSWTATPGSHQICAFADDVDRFAESNEGNNSLCVSVTVPQPTALPDVVVNAINFSMLNPAPNEPVFILVDIQNIGSVATPTGIGVGVGVRVDGAYVGSFFARNGLGQAISLAGGQTSSGKVSWTPTVGSHQVCAYVDDVDRFPETNESNNSRCVTIDISPVVLPDLVIGHIFVQPANPTAGQSVTFTTWTINQGNAPPPAGVTVGTGFRLDGAYVGAAFAPSSSTLISGTGYPGDVHWTATPGSHEFCAFADDVDRFLESDETNNNDCVTVVVP